MLTPTRSTTKQTTLLDTFFTSTKSPISSKKLASNTDSNISADNSIPFLLIHKKNSALEIRNGKSAITLDSEACFIPCTSNQSINQSTLPNLDNSLTLEQHAILQNDKNSMAVSTPTELNKNFYLFYHEGLSFSPSFSTKRANLAQDKRSVSFRNRMLKTTLKNLNNCFTLNAPKNMISGPDRCYSNETLYQDDISNLSVPIRCRYSNGKSKGIGKASFSDETGYISIVESKKNFSFTKNAKSSGIKVLSRWKAHNDSIFNFIWCPDDQRLVTSSADCTMGLWDIETKTLVSSYSGHSGTIYALDIGQSDMNTIVSGGRDGSICLWDLRCNIKHSSNSHVPNREPSYLLLGAHSTPTSLFSPKVKRNSVYSNSPRNSLKLPNKRSNTSIVTSIRFLLNGYTACSSSSEDGSVHFWDTRNFPSSRTGSYSSNYKSLIGQTSNPFKKSRGISSLALAPDGRSIFASSIDNSVYLYDTLIPASPIAVFSADSLRIQSFNNEIDIDPNGHWLASGSSNGFIHLFDLKKAGKKLKSRARSNSQVSNSDLQFPLEIDSSDTSLEGHTDDTCSVSWCPWLEQDWSDVNTFQHQLMSCSDDYSVRFWDSYTERSLARHYGFKSFDHFYSNQNLTSDGYGFTQEQLS